MTFTVPHGLCPLMVTLPVPFVWSKPVVLATDLNLHPPTSATSARMDRPSHAKHEKAHLARWLPVTTIRGTRDSRIFEVYGFS